MGTIFFGDKKEEFCVRGEKDGLEGRCSRAGNGTGGQALYLIGVVRGLFGKVFAGQIAVKVHDTVDDGGVTLQSHFLFKPVVKNRGDEGALKGGTGFFFDNRCQGHGLMDGQAYTFGACLPLRGKHSLESGKQCGDDFSRGDIFWEKVGVGKKVSFQIGGRNIQLFGKGGIKGQFEEFRGTAQLGFGYKGGHLAQGQPFGDGEPVESNFTADKGGQDPGRRHVC